MNVASAANHYIREGATGADDGSDWTDAWTDWPANLTRGDTYYFADGTYSGYFFDDAESGSTYITCQKATTSDHGTETGWDNAYGDGQAVFGGGHFEYGYYKIYGATGGGPGSWDSGHGFKWTKSTSGQMMTFEGSESPDYKNPPDYIEFKNCEFQHRGIGQGTTDDIIYCIKADTYGNFEGASNILFSYCYLHDCSRMPFNTQDLDTWTVEYCLIARNDSTAINHAEGWQDNASRNITIRYCIWEDIEGTAVIALKTDSGHDTNNWFIYGNVFVYTDSYYSGKTGGVGEGVIAQDNGDTTASDIYFYNNTVIQINGYRTGIEIYDGTGFASNNLWWKCWRNDASDWGNVHMKNTTLSYNSYATNFAGTPVLNVPGDWTLGTEDETLSSVSPDLLTDRANGDYSLVSPNTLKAGTTLGATYNTDMFGNTRGADGTWDRGAIEYKETYLFGWTQ